MSASKELSILLDEMITAGNTLAKTAKALKELYSSSEEESKTKASKKKETPEVPAKAEVKKEPSKTTEKSYSYEEVRKICAAKSVQEEGRHKREVINTIKKYANGQSLSKVSPSDYIALVAEIEVIGNAK